MDTLSTRLIQRGSPFELQDAVNNGIKCKIFPRGPQTLQDVFMKTASFGQSEFIVSGNERLSFIQALKQANVLSHYLQKRYGVIKGSRVALLIANCPEWIIAFTAISLASAIAVIVYVDSDKDILFSVLEITNCSLIVVDEGHAEKLGKIHITCPVIVFHDSEFVGFVPERKIKEIPKLEPDDETLIAFTSGTTGIPKGIILSHRNLTTGLMNMMLGGYLMNHSAVNKKVKTNSIPSNLQPCSLLLSPLSHISGFAHVLLMCWLGGKIVLMPEWDVQQAMVLIEREKVRSLNGISHEMIKELLRTDHSKYNLESLTNINLHGSALTQSLITEISEKFPHISIGSGYGMTETCGSISNISGTELINNPNACGFVLPSVDVKIIGDDGTELPIGETGEICIRGAMVMKGYCGDSKTTSEVLKDGWLRTGDIGRIDSEGQLYVIDRANDAIYYNGNSIPTREIENSVAEIDRIDEAILLGFTGIHYEKIALVILPNQGRHIDEKKLCSEINQLSCHLPIIPEIIFVESLPRTISGKINRNELRRQMIGKLIIEKDSSLRS